MISATKTEAMLLVPVFFEPEDEFWREPESIPLLTALFRELKGLDMPVLVTSDDTAVLDAAGRAGLNCVEILHPASDSPRSVLPPRSEAAAQCALDAGIAPRIFAALNFRNPHAVSLMQEALELQTASDAALVTSVFRPRDHPCQMYTAFSMVAAGLVSGSEPRHSGTLLFGSESNMVECAASGLRLTPGKGCGPDTLLAVTTSMDGEARTRLYSPQQYAPLPASGEQAVWYILAPAEDGVVDVRLPFSPSEELWTYSTAGTPMLPTSQPLNGRQQFPDTAVCDGTLAVWKHFGAQHLDTVSFEPPVCFVLPEGKSVLIRTLVGYLSWQVDTEMSGTGVRGTMPQQDACEQRTER